MKINLILFDKITPILLSLILSIISFQAKSETRPESTPSGTLPILYINVYQLDEQGDILSDSDGMPIYDNDIIDYNILDKNKRKGEYWLDMNGCQWLIDLGCESVGSAENPLPLEINARGNFTRLGFVKKPFKIKLGKKDNLLGLTPEKSKHYALLAHADEIWGFLRNFVGFNLGKRIGLQWTPNMQPLELIINGDYRGLYFLTESVKIQKGRIDIEEVESAEANPLLVSGGYVVELDNGYEPLYKQIRVAEKYCSTGHKYPQILATIESPDSCSALQLDFLKHQINKINDLTGDNSDELWSYLDIDDAVRYYLVEEIINHREAYHGSTFLFRNRGVGEKWHFGPLWDQGLAFNKVKEDFVYNVDPYGNHWITSFRENAKFNAVLYDTWKWFMSNKYDGLYDDIYEYIDHIKAAAQSDYARWKDTGVPYRPDGGTVREVGDNTNIEALRDSVISKLELKVNWLKTQFGDYTSGTFPEPQRDNTVAAPLPDFLLAAIEEVQAKQVELIDGEPYTNSINKEGMNITYVRTFNNTNWQALYIPFNMCYDEWSKYAEVAEINGVHQFDNDGDGQFDETILEFRKVTYGELLPNTPYVIKAKKAKEVTFECWDKILSAAPEQDGSVWCASTRQMYTLTGTYQPKTITGDYALSGGVFFRATDTSPQLQPYRIYLNIENVNNGYGVPLTNSPQKIRIMVDGEDETEYFDDIIGDQNTEDIYYDIVGRKVLKPKSGFYIHNGHKIYIK